MTLYHPPTQNGLQKTLGAQLDQGVTASATFNNVTGIQNKPGLFVVDRIDSDGNEKNASFREYISFEGTSGSTVTTLVRGLGGTTDQDHAIGAVVEFVSDVVQMQAIIDALESKTGVDTDYVSGTAGTNNYTAKWNADGDLVDGADIMGKALSIEVFPGLSNVSTGDGKAYFTIPNHLNGARISAVHGRVITAGNTGTTDIQIRNVTDAVDVLSTKLTIDSGETGSDTAATPAVINTSNDDVATNDLFAIDVDAISTTAPKGLVVRIEFASA